MALCGAAARRPPASARSAQRVGHRARYRAPARLRRRGRIIGTQERRCPNGRRRIAGRPRSHPCRASGEGRETGIGMPATPLCSGHYPLRRLATKEPLYSAASVGELRLELRKTLPMHQRDFLELPQQLLGRLGRCPQIGEVRQDILLHLDVSLARSDVAINRVQFVFDRSHPQLIQVKQ